MVMRENQGGQAYAYAAEAPPATTTKKAKYREDDLTMQMNIMYDRRVVRGNTYAAQILPAEPPNMSPPTAKPARRPKASTRKPATPPPVHGRRHMDIQTDAYLEELTDVVPEVEVETQTDAFLDRPVTPLFVPQKHGVDVDTQIEEGDLFDFDFEVEPMLEVIVGKTLEQGLMEVMEEEELSAMRAHQEHFEQVRNMELVAIQKMEQAERRKAEEKERRMEQERARLESERTVREKVAASTFARGYLDGMVGSVLDGLWDQGYFYDPVERDVAEEFMPWLVEAAQKHVEEQRTARAIVSALVADALAIQAQSMARADKARLATMAAQEAASAKRAAERDALAQAEAAATEGRAAYILGELIPAIASKEQVASVRAGLEEKAKGAVTTQWEEAKAKVGEQAREAAEAAKAEAEAAQADAAAEGGDEAAAPTQPAVDVEQMVADAMAEVPEPAVKAITAGDVLSAMIDASPELKDTIIVNLAIQKLGEESWIHDERFAGELRPAPPAE